MVSVEARPPGFSLESIISHEGPFYFEVSNASDAGQWMHTIWFKRLAAPRPVGPAPITSTSTLLRELVRNHHNIVEDVQFLRHFQRRNEKKHTIDEQEKVPSINKQVCEIDFGLHELVAGSGTPQA